MIILATRSTLHNKFQSIPLLLLFAKSYTQPSRSRYNPIYPNTPYWLCLALVNLTVSGHVYVKTDNRTSILPNVSNCLNTIIYPTTSLSQIITKPMAGILFSLSPLLKQTLRAEGSFLPYAIFCGAQPKVFAFSHLKYTIQHPAHAIPRHRGNGEYAEKRTMAFMKDIN